MVDKISSNERFDFVTTNNVYKVLFWITLPLIGNVFVIKLFDLSNVYFSSYLGASELAAIMFVTPIINIVLGLTNALAIAVNAYLVNAFVSNNQSIKRKKFAITWWLTLMMGIPICVFSIVFSTEILTFLNATPGIVENSSIYFKIMMFGIFFDFITYYYYGVTRAKADMKTTFYYTLISNILRFILSYITIIVFQYEMVALAMANTLPKFVLGIYTIYKLSLEPCFSFFHFKVEIKKFVPFIVLFIPIAMDKFSMNLGFVVLNSIIIEFDEVILSAFSITNSINSIFFSITIGFATGLVTVISYNMQNNDRQRCMEIMKASIKLLTLFSLVVSLALYIYAPQIVTFFCAGDNTLEAATIRAMRTYSISIFGYGYAQIYFGLYYALQRPKIAMILSMIRLWILRIGFIVLLIAVTNMQEYAIWIGMLISNFALLPLIFIIQKNPKLSFKSR